MSARTGYSGLQIGIHWIVAVLIFAAYFTSDGMGRALRTRIETGASGVDGNTPHVWLGGAVFLLVLIRIIVRWRSGAPDHAPETPALVATAATWGHRLIYLLMVLVPLGGAVTWYGGIEAAGDIHEILGNAFMLVVMAHAVIAIGHEVLWSDGTLNRMIKPGD